MKILTLLTVGLILGSCTVTYQPLTRSVNQAANQADSTPVIASDEAAWRNLDIAQQLYYRRQDQEALEVLQATQRYSEQTANLTLQAYIQQNLGTIYLEQRRYNEAETALRASLALFEQTTNKNTRDLTVEAYAVAHLVVLYMDTGNYRELLVINSRAQTIFEAISDQEGVLAMMNTLGLAYAQLGQLDLALDAYQAALAAAQAAGDAGAQASSRQGIVSVEQNLNNLSAVHDNLSALLESAKQQGNAADELEIRIAKANTLRLQGNYQAALSDLEQALALAQDTAQLHLEGEIWLLSGTVRRALGHYDIARQAYERGLTIWRETDNRYWEAVTLNNLGSLLTQQGLYTDALAALHQALQIRQEIGDKAGAIITRENINVVETLQTTEAEGIPSLPDTTASLSLREQGILMNNQASHWLLQGDYNRAKATFEAALELRYEAGDRYGEALTLVGIGLTYHLHDQLGPARDYYESARERFDELGNTAEASKVLGLLGGLYLQTDDLQQSFTYIAEAVDLSETLRDAQILDESKTLLSDEVASIYRTAVSLSILLNEPERAFDYTERARARNFLDQLGNTLPDVRANQDASVTNLKTLQTQITRLEQEKNSEIARGAQGNWDKVAGILQELQHLQASYRNTLSYLQRHHPEYATLLSISPVGLSSIQHYLADHETLVSYFVTSQHTYAFTMTQRSFEPLVLNITQSELETALEAFLASLQSSDTTPVHQVLTELYDSLIQPLHDAQMLTTPHVTIVPHGLLHSLPFTSLWNANEQAYFGDAYTVSYLPSASVLPLLQQKAATRQKGERLLAMAYAYPEGFSYLPYATQEALDVAQMYGTEAFVDQVATKNVLWQQANDKDIILIAAHGQLNSQIPLFSRLMLAPDESDNGSLTVAEIFTLNLQNSSLVVLSACETNQGQLTRGDDVINLTRAFMYAGAPAVIASLWHVNDAATHLLITTFFENYKATQNAAWALQQAQQTVRANSSYAHPYYWAAFVLQGLP